MIASLFYAQPVPKALSVISVRSALPLATNGTQEFPCDHIKICVTIKISFISFISAGT